MAFWESKGPTPVMPYFSEDVNPSGLRAKSFLGRLALGVALIQPLSLAHLFLSYLSYPSLFYVSLSTYTLNYQWLHFRFPRNAESP